jgi:hypothetical protein
LALAVALPLAAGLALRLWMLRNLFQVNGDALVYGDLAKNLLRYGRFALTLPSGNTCPTLIRLPGYPLFLAACFRIFGMENYFAAACVQIALDLLGCLLVADFVRRIAPAPISRGAALAALWLASICPFTASYSAAPLTETPTLFMLALAMWAMVRFRDQPRWWNALWFTFAVTCAALLRPDGALAAVAFAPALVIGLERNPSNSADSDCARSGFFLMKKPFEERTSGYTRSDSAVPRGAIAPRKLMRMTVACVLLALAPFAVWTARNWRVFHVFEPLAPRLANDPDENPNPGWERWVKSWCLDFVSTYDIYWNVPGDKLDLSKLPSRAFDGPAQYAETAALAARYNSQGMKITPDIDARFDKLARERIAAHPLRYYVGLPLGRVADMWLRPRVENLPIDLDWWVYSKHHAETVFSWVYVALNALYLLLGIAGLCLPPLRRRPVAGGPFDRNPGNSAHLEEVRSGLFLMKKPLVWYPRSSLKNIRRSFDFVYRKNAANSAQDDKSIYYTNFGDRTREGRASGYDGPDSAVWAALLAYVLLRSALLLTVAAPETRYTLECFPMIFAAGGIALWWLASRLYLPKLKAPLGNG